MSKKILSQNQLTLLPEASLAKMLVLPEIGKDCTERGLHFGASLPDSFAELNQDGFWLRMYQGCYQVTMEGSLETYLETWPRSGYNAGMGNVT